MNGDWWPSVDGKPYVPRSSPRSYEPKTGLHMTEYLTKDLDLVEDPFDTLVREIAQEREAAFLEGFIAGRHVERESWCLRYPDLANRDAVESPLADRIEEIIDALERHVEGD